MSSAAGGASDSVLEAGRATGCFFAAQPTRSSKTPAKRSSCPLFSLSHARCRWQSWLHARQQLMADSKMVDF